MSASTLSVRARLTSAISRVISGIHNSRDFRSPKPSRDQRNLGVEELEERILFGYFSLNSPWEDLPPTSPSTSPCSTASGGGPASSGGSLADDVGGAYQPSGPALGGANPRNSEISFSGGNETVVPSAGHSVAAAETGRPVVAMTGLPNVSATDVSSNAMGFTFAHTRTWTGLDNGSYNGNGWSNNELPYLVVGGGTNGASTPGGTIGTGVMTGTGGDSRISVIYGGTTAYTFYNSSGTSYTPFTDYGVTLQYISAPTPVIELTDAGGNVTEFYDVHRTAGTPDPYSLALNLPSLYGRFKSWTSANGTTSIVATYNSSGYVTNLVRSDSVTGESDQMVYNYATVTNDLVTTKSGTPPTLLSSVTLQRLVSGSWQNIQQATYTYCTGRVPDGHGSYTDDLIGGRLGDLEYATTQNWSAASSSWQTTDTTYYRYYKFTGESDGVNSQGPTNVWFGPNDPRNTTGGPAPVWTATGGQTDEDITIASGLKMVVDGPALARLASAVPNYQTASDATLEPYVNNYFQYERFGDHVGVDGNPTFGAPSYYSNQSYPWRTGYRSETQYRATLEIANGAGCSCSSGQGTYKYEYATNYSTDNIGGQYTNGGYSWSTYDPNVWRTKTTEFLPSDDPNWASHDRNVVYTNELGQPLLSLLVHVNSTAVSITGMSIAQDPNDTSLPVNAQVTVTAPNHGLSVGDSVAISGVLPEMFDGVFKVTSVADANTFTFTLPFTYFDGVPADIPTPYVNTNGNSSGLSKVLGQWATAYRYDSQGRLIEKDEPSAVMGYDDSQMDPVDAAEGVVTAGNAEITDGWIAQNSGIVHYYDYGTTTSATSGTPGDVAGYFKDEKISEGTNNLGFSPIILDAQNYIAHTSGGVTVYALHSYTQYGQTGGGDARTTTYTYTTWLGNQVEAITTSLPVISSAQNGPAVADTSNSFFDQYGRTIWTMDGDGHVDYTAYDANGGIVQQITDVNYGDLTGAQQSSFNTTGWAQPAGLNLVTNYTVDNQGRTTSVTSPNGNVTYTVYNDANHETRIYPGFNGTTATGPITIYRQYWPAAGSGDMYYTETITSTATPHLTGGVPDGTEAINASNIASVQRDFTNSGGQVSWTDSYFNFSGLTYSQAVLPDGSGAPIDIGSQATFGNLWAGQFYRTTLLYDDRGRQSETIEPTGTIDISVFDPLGRVSSKWVGTNATPGANGDDWSPDNQGAGSNMMDVEDDGYNDSMPATPPVPAAPSLTNYGTQSYINDMHATYYVKITYVGPGGESQFSSESSLYVGDNDALVVNSPSAASGATGWNVYVSTASGQEVLQNTSGPMGFGGSWTENFTGGLTPGGRTDPMLSNITDSGNAAATLSQVTTHPGLGQADRVTQFLYDWRNRPVAEKDGVQSTETDGAHRPITYTIFDNLNEPTSNFQYDGDGIPLSDFASTAANDSAPTADASALRAKSTSSYDDQGRVYQQQTFSVDQTTGAIGSALTTNTFFDHRGNAIAVFSPGGQVTKSVYDGAGRLSSQYVTDGGALNNSGTQQKDWTHASSVFSDVVLSETDNSYDGDGNVILTTSRDRFDNALQTGVGSTGPLSNPSTSPTSAVAAYSFSEGSGTTTADSSGNKRTGTLNGGVTWTTSGHAGDALTFDGTSGYVDLTNPTQMNFTGQITLSAWIKPNSTAGLQDIIAHGYASSEVFLRIHNGNYEIGSWDGTTEYFTSYAIPSGDLGNWVHLAGVYDGTAWKLYRNGVLVSSTASSTGALTVSADWVIGASAVSTDRRFFSGSIDEARIYAYGLNAGEVASLASDMAPARASYLADYYDAADRLTDQVNVGTDGGTEYSRPSTVPSRSDTALVTHSDYDPAGNVLDTVDPRNIMTQFGYDMLGRKMQEIDASTGGSPATGMNVTNYSYDGNDGVLTMQAYQPNGTTSPSQTTAYLYGVGGTVGANLFSNDVLSKVEYPDPTTGNAGTSPSDDVLTTYDLLGEALTQKDQNQTSHSYSYDILGRLSLDSITALGTGVDGSVMALGYSYSPLGQPYQQTSYSDAAGTTVVNQIQNNYNGYGQLIAQYQAVSGSVNTSSTPVTQYTYSQPTGANYSRLTSMTYPNGRVLDYAYNSGLDSDISRVSALSDDSGSGAGNIQSYSYLGLSTIVLATDANDYQLTYVKRGGDSLGDAGDQYAGLDRFGRVVDLIWSIAGFHSQTERLKYGYDRDGNVLYENNLENPSLSELFHPNSTSSGDDNTDYDGLNRITGFIRGALSASGNNGTTLDTVSTPSTLSGSTQSWSLDSIGNANSITTDGTGQSRTFNSQNEATTVGSNTLGYDSNGNTTTDDQGHTLVYDAWNRLVAVKNGSTTLAGYTYDANGNRITQTENSATTNLYYTTAAQVIEERQGSTVTDQYVWGLMYVNDQVLRDDNSTAGSFGKSGSGLGERMFIQQDANWNVIALSPSYSGVAEEFTYSPYGVRTVLALGGTPTTDAYNITYGFQGMRYDPVTGLLHADDRDYGPTMERWDQPDSGGATGSPALNPVVQQAVQNLETATVNRLCTVPPDMSSLLPYADGSNRYQLEQSRPNEALDPSGLGLLKWIYTGRWNATDEEYNAATQAAAAWLHCHSPVRGGYVGGSAPIEKTTINLGFGRKAGVEAGVGAGWTIDDGGFGYGEIGGGIEGPNGWVGVGGGYYAGSSGHGAFAGGGAAYGGAQGTISGGQVYLGIGKGPLSAGLIIDPTKFADPDYWHWTDHGCGCRQ